MRQHEVTLRQYIREGKSRSVCVFERKLTGVLLTVMYFRYSSYLICISDTSGGSKKLSDDGRLLPKHVGSSI
jgi:hypothetical protein